MRKIALGILSFILILLIPIVIIGFAAMPLLQPAVYTTTFEKLGIYDKIPQFLAEKDPVMGELFSKEFIKTNFGRMIADTLAYVRGETNVLDLSLPINKDAIRSIFLQKLNSIPDCPSGVLPSSQQNPECLPAGIDKTEYMNDALSKIQIPEKIDILQSQPQLKNGIDKIRDGVSFFYRALYGLLALSIALILLMAFITRHSKKSMLKWIGTTLLISGVTVLAASFVLTNVVISAVTSQTGISGTVSSIVTSIIDALSGTMRMYSIAVVVAGIVLYITSRKVKEKKKA